ncbi:MAG: flavin reductase family protein [Pseudomonadota bacterium]
MSDTNDQRALRNALGTFATGVTVVTTVDDGGQHWGFTANSFTSVSLDPPLVLFCLTHQAESMPAFAHASSFIVNVLASEQEAISNLFASRGVDKFAEVDFQPGETGCARITGAVAWFECAMTQKIDAGDHAIFIGRVLDYGSNDADPLAYCRGRYGTVHAR